MGFYDCLLFCVAIGGYAIFYINSEDLELKNITNNDIAASNLISLPLLGTFRLICAAVVLITNTFVLFDREGLTITVSMSSGHTVKAHLKHFERFTTFTVWSWSLIGLYFTLTSYCSFITYFRPEIEIPLVILQFIWILFEVQFAISVLITVLVTYVLIPGGKARGIPVSNFFKITPLLMHNANVIFMVIESLVNLIPYKMNHMPYPMLYGLVYVAFSWLWYKHKGVFYYFFLDYSRPWAVLMYAGVMLALVVFFCVGVVMYQLEETHSPLSYTVIVVSVLMILKFRE